MKDKKFESVEKVIDAAKSTANAKTNGCRSAKII